MTTRIAPIRTLLLLVLTWLSLIPGAFSQTPDRPLPPPPADLGTRLGQVGQLLDGLYGPCATRVLRVREDRVSLELAPGVQPGDLFEVFPSGTILLGPDAVGNREIPPLATVRVMSIKADHLDAIFENGPVALPVFAPAKRAFGSRALAVVWDTIPPLLAPLIASWDLTTVLYQAIESHVPIPLTAVPPPEALASQIPPYHSLYADLPATDMLRVRVTENGLRVSWMSMAGGSTNEIPVSLPLYSATYTPRFAFAAGSTIPLTSQGSLRVARLPAPVCECVSLPPDSPAPGLWCLSDTGVVQLVPHDKTLTVAGGLGLAFEQQPPYRRHGAGVLRAAVDDDHWQLEAHRGQGGEGVLLRWSGSGIRQEGTIPGLPYSTHVPLQGLVAPIDGSGAGRFLRPAELPASLGSPLVALSMDDFGEVVAAIDGTAALTLASTKGGSLPGLPGPYGGALAFTPSALYVIQGTRVVRIPRDSSGLLLPGATQSPSLPGLPLSVTIDNDDNAWVVVESPEAASLLVQVPATTWTASNGKSSGRSWPVMGGAVRLGMPVESLDLTPEGVSTLLERQAFSALYDTPVRLLPDGKTAPLAARQVSANSASDEWEIMLQPGLEWPDGTAATAAQVKQGWEQTIRAHPLGAPAFELVVGYGAFRSGPATTVSGVEVVDARTLKIQLSRPEARFDTFLADPTFAIVRGDRHVLSGSGARVSFRQGTGPYQPVRMTGQSVELSRNRLHVQGMPFLQSWRWDLLGSQEAVSRAYLAGRLDVAPQGPADWAALASHPGYAGHQVENVGQSTLGLLVNPESPRLGRSLGARDAFLRAPDLLSLRRITLAGYVDEARGHFSDRLGTPAVPRPGLVPAEPGAIRLAVPAEQREWMPAALRLKSELEGQDPRWAIDIVSLPLTSLRTGRADWDVALWTFAGAPQPVLAESREFRALWARWRGPASGAEQAHELEATLAAGGWWRPIGHPRQLWLRAPGLKQTLGPGRQAPGWSDAWWDR